ncbi:7276_t:CDS:1, partial [Racocetra fulgida]
MTVKTVNNLRITYLTFEPLALYYLRLLDNLNNYITVKIIRLLCDLSNHITVKTVNNLSYYLLN